MVSPLGAPPRMSTFRLVLSELLTKYQRARGQRVATAAEVAGLDDRALFARVQSLRPKAPPGTWSRQSRRRGRD